MASLWNQSTDELTLEHEAGSAPSDVSTAPLSFAAEKRIFLNCYGLAASRCRELLDSIKKLEVYFEHPSAHVSLPTYMFGTSGAHHVAKMVDKVWSVHEVVLMMHEELKPLQHKLDNKSAEVATLSKQLEGMKDTYKEEHIKPLLEQIAAKDKALVDKDKSLATTEKALAKKDKALAEKVRDLTFAEELNYKRQEEHKSEMGKLRLKVDGCERELAIAKKKPDEVRAVFFAKIQKAHEKVRDLEQSLKVKDDRIAVLELDYQTVCKGFEDEKARGEKRKAAIERFKFEYEKLKEERDKLRSLQLAQHPSFETQARESRKTADEALAQATKLEKENEQLMNERLRDGKVISALEKDLAEERERSKLLNEKLDLFLVTAAKVASM